MRPVATVAEIRAADRATLAHVDHATLVVRSGTAVAFGALEMLGSGYGRRVVLVAGKGDNGADGRAAARLLGRRGALVSVVEAAGAPPVLPECDLVIDAAYGTGFRGRYDAPAVPDGTPVLAVDIPSGVDGDTGAAPGRPLRADRTVTLAALKPGLLQGDGRDLAGEVWVADIGVRVDRPAIGLVEDADVAMLVPRRPRASQKWDSALVVVAGSPGMEGAAVLVATGASHAGAGMVRLAVPGTVGAAGAGVGVVPGPWPVEVVREHLPPEGWADEVLALLGRARALVVGPGLGRSAATGAEVRRLVARSPVPVVVDADALFALGDVATARALVGGGGVTRPVVLTPHDGELERLTGSAPGDDRVAAARALARQTGAVVLLKGPLTAVAVPPGSGGAGGADGAGDGEPGADGGGRADGSGGGEPGADGGGADAAADGGNGAAGDVLLAAAGTPSLATAGTGDVLSGIVGAFITRGVPPSVAAAVGAHVHGRAAGTGPVEGLVAPDLPVLVSAWLSGAVGRRRPPVLRGGGRG